MIVSFPCVKLQSGKQCLCMYSLPSGLGKGMHSSHPSSSASSSFRNELKITGLAEAVEGRVNVILSNGQVCFIPLHSMVGNINH